MLLALMALGPVTVGCGDEATETVSVPGVEADGDPTGETVPESSGEARDSTDTSESDPLGVPEFYERYRMAADPLFQAAPGLVGATYAFSWLDHENETLVLLATEPVPDDVQTSLAELIPPELPIEYRIVDNTEAELEATHQLLTQNPDRIGPVTGFGTVPIENKVEITTSDIELTRAKLQELGVDLLTVDVQQTPGTGPTDNYQAGGVDGPVLYSGSFTGNRLDAELIGNITIEVPCIFLSDPNDPGFRSLIVWPLGTTWQPDPPAVVLPNGDEVTDGDTVEGSGGSVGLDAVKRIAGQPGTMVVEACSAQTEQNVAVFNFESTVTVLDS